MGQTSGGAETQMEVGKLVQVLLTGLFVGSSWVVMSRVIRRVAMTLLTLLITSHEPSSRG